MSGFNSVVVLGRLVSAEQISTRSGSLMLKAVLEVTTYRRSADGNGEEFQTRVPATLFSKLAETFEKYVLPGDLVQLVGRLEGFERKGKDHASWLTLSFIAESLILLPNNRSSSMTHTSAPAPQKTTPASSVRERPWRSKPAEPYAPLNEFGEPASLPW